MRSAEAGRKRRGRNADGDATSEEVRDPEDPPRTDGSVGFGCKVLTILAGVTLTVTVAPSVVSFATNPSSAFDDPDLEFLDEPAVQHLLVPRGINASHNYKEIEDPLHQSKQEMENFWLNDSMMQGLHAGDLFADEFFEHHEPNFGLDDHEESVSSSDFLDEKPENGKSDPGAPPGTAEDSLTHGNTSYNSPEIDSQQPSGDTPMGIVLKEKLPTDSDSAAVEPTLPVGQPLLETTHPNAVDALRSDSAAVDPTLPVGLPWLETTQPNSADELQPSARKAVIGEQEGSLPQASSTTKQTDPEVRSNVITSRNITNTTQQPKVPGGISGTTGLSNKSSYHSTSVVSVGTEHMSTETPLPQTTPQSYLSEHDMQHRLDVPRNATNGSKLAGAFKMQATNSNVALKPKPPAGLHDARGHAEKNSTPAMGVEESTAVIQLPTGKAITTTPTSEAKTNLPVSKTETELDTSVGNTMAAESTTSMHAPTEKSNLLAKGRSTTISVGSVNTSTSFAQKRSERSSGLKVKTSTQSGQSGASISDSTGAETRTQVTSKAPIIISTTLPVVVTPAANTTTPIPAIVTKRTGAATMLSGTQGQAASTTSYDAAEKSTSLSMSGGQVTTMLFPSPAPSPLSVMPNTGSTQLPLPPQEVKLPTATPSSSAPPTSAITTDTHPLTTSRTIGTPLPESWSKQRRQHEA